MRLNNYTTSELVQKIGQLDERYVELKKITKSLNCPNAKATLQIQLTVYKNSKALILEELIRRQPELNFDIEIQSSSSDCLGSSPVHSLPAPT
ncbi:MAG: hypothetical protein K0S26_3184, partial [Bacteroidota bacterium]|nr:hypothetical protein [Bacteroidota bacterium]